MHLHSLVEFLVFQRSIDLVDWKREKMLPVVAWNFDGSTNVSCAFEVSGGFVGNCLDRIPTLRIIIQNDVLVMGLVENTTDMIAWSGKREKI